MAGTQKKAAATTVATPAPTTSKTDAKPTTPAKAVAAKAPVVKAETKKAEAVAVVAAPVVEATKAETDAAVVAPSLLDKVESKINLLSSVLKETLVELKALKKEYERMKKSVEKTERKRANARTNPNGFAKPTPITDELCVFLSLPTGSVMSRTDVTRRINAYIKEHSLNKPDNKRIILPDPSLRKILNVKDGDEISFFSLQKYLSPLFKKATPPVAVASA
jgi:chromatin remodeling complex protein RSC6